MRSVSRLELLVVLVVLPLMALAACRERKSSPPVDAVGGDASTPRTAEPVPLPSAVAVPTFQPSQLAPFAPIPAGVDAPVLDEVALLGKRLYGERALSSGHDVSCASCHALAAAGADPPHATSTGTQKRATKRNTPTVLNAAGSFAQGWDARASTTEEFLPDHLADPSVMGMPAGAELGRALASYAASFRRAFPDAPPAVSVETVARALAAYTAKLFARSRWDRYLSGDPAALTGDELSGLAMFVEAGCTTCHQGKYLGATQVQRLGIAKPWPGPAGADLGRYEVTKQEADRGMFKVPSLRNVTLTPPYLHDGSVATLDDAVRLMARHQVGKELSAVQVAAIVRFLGTLEGRPPTALGPPSAP